MERALQLLERDLTPDQVKDRLVAEGVTPGDAAAVMERVLELRAAVDLAEGKRNLLVEGRRHSMACARCRMRIVLLLLVFATSVPFAGEPSPVGSDADRGWEALVGGEVATAIALFDARLEQDDHDASALRGLLVARMLGGEETAGVRGIERYGGKVKGSVYDLDLMTLVRTLSSTLDRSLAETLHRFHHSRWKNDHLLPEARLQHLRLAIEYARLCGAGDDARNLPKLVSFCDRWSLLGPFDNTSGMGRRTVHLERWEPDGRTYTGKGGMRVHWFSPPLHAPDGTITPNDHFWRGGATTAYLSTHFVMEEDGVVDLHLMVSGDVVVRLDGARLIDGHGEFDDGTSLDWRLELTGGQHHLALKLSGDDDDDARVFICLTDTLSRAVKGIVFRSVPDGDIDEGRLLHWRPLRDPLEVAIGTDRDVSSVERAFWLAVHRLFHADGDAFDGALADLASAGAGDAMISFLEGWRALQDGRSQDARKLLATATTAHPDLVAPRLVLATADYTKGRYERAASAARSVAEASPGCLYARQLLIQSLLAMGRLTRAEEVAAATAEAFPRSPLGYHFLAEIAGRRGLQRERQRWEEKEQEFLDDLDRYLTSFQRQAQKEQYGRAHHSLGELYRRFPTSAALAKGYIGMLLADGKLAEADHLIRQCSRIFPQDVDIILYDALLRENCYNRYLDQVDLAARVLHKSRDEIKQILAAGRTLDIHLTPDLVKRTAREICREEAARLVGEALAIDPGNITLHDRLCELLGKAPLVSFLVRRDVGQVLSRRRAGGTTSAGTHATILLDHAQRFLYDSHSGVLDENLVVQVHDETGCDRWRRYSMGPSRFLNEVTILESRVFKSDGSQVEAEQTPTDIVFPELVPGDVIQLHYRVQQRTGGLLAGCFWDSHVFAATDSVVESRYDLIRPDTVVVGKKVWNAVQGGPVSYSRETLPGHYVRDTWVSSHIAPLAREPFEPDARLVAPWLGLSNIDSWSRIAHWYDDLSRGQCVASATVTAVAESLVAGKDDRLERAQALLSFVSGQIRYESVPLLQGPLVPRSADEVLRERYGDCKDKACLLIALLHAVGIGDACFALTSPWTQASVVGLPSPAFDHAVVALPDTAGGFLWLDPTVPWASTRWCPRALVGAPALVVREGEGTIRTIEESDRNRIDLLVEATASFGTDGGLELSRRECYPAGPVAAALRTSWQDRGLRAMQADLQAELAQIMPGLEIYDYQVTGAANGSDTLVVSYRCVVPHAVQCSGRIMTGRLPLRCLVRPSLAQLVASRNRRRPIDLRRLRHREREHLVLRWPDGWSVLQMPQAITAESIGGRTAIACRVRGNQLETVRELELRGKVVSPEAYPDVKAMLEGLWQTLGQMVVLQRVGG